MQNAEDFSIKSPEILSDTLLHRLIDKWYICQQVFCEHATTNKNWRRWYVLRLSNKSIGLLSEDSPHFLKFPCLS